MVALSRSSSAVVALQVVSLLVSSSKAMSLEALGRRTPQTNAVCDQEYAWADNQKQKSPCMVAAEAIAPCNGGNWNVPALIAPNQMYTNPGLNGTAASVCSCSWVAYNLLSACADCQGYPQAIRIWADYSSQCGQLASTTEPYPREYLADDTSIPAWATTNPTQWSDRRYTASQAKSIAQQGRPDLTRSQAAPKKGSSIGAIVGGVVGGLVAIAIAAGVAYYMLRKHRQNEPAKEEYSDKAQGHHRGPSDTTMTSLGYTSMTSPSPGPGPHGVGAPTIRTHTTSVNNFSVFGSPENTLYTTSPSPPPRQQVVSANPEDFIIPFSLQHQRVDSSTSLLNRDRKSPNGPITVYDSPNAPPAMAGDALYHTPERPRVNPPAYSPHPTEDTPSASGSRPRVRNLHTTNSSDADLSYASFHQSSQGQGNSSGSDIFTSHPMDNESAFGGTAQRTTYTSPSSYPRDVKRRPTEDSINPSNIG